MSQALLIAEPRGSGKTVLRIPLEAIDPNPYQPRRLFEERALYELADSILAFGLLQPIAVRRINGGRYELISGERRWRACKLAQLTHIDAIVQNVQDADSAILALIENMQRENLHFLEEAEGYASLLRDHRLTQDDMARRLSKSQSTVANKVRLLKLPAPIRLRIVQLDLTERHARALLRLPDEKAQLAVLELIARFGWNVRKTEEGIALYLQRLQDEEARNDRRSRIKSYIRDPRLFLNSMQAVLQQMKDAGFEPQWEQQRSPGELVVKIVIPLCAR